MSFPKAFPAARIAVIVAAVCACAGCDVNSALERLTQARRLSADLLIHFAKDVDAGNRAVMADTDATSTASAREAEQAAAAVQADVDALAPILQGLRFSEEMTLLETFRQQFAEYRALDRTILDLAVENTNVKAQRLSFSSGQDAVDALRDALEALVPVDPAKDTWRVKALAATALARAREIQALEAPHIAEADDADMTAIEKRMALSETAVRDALKTLAGAVQPASRPQLAAATAAFDRLMDVNAQIVRLSRRNSNVRSLALALNQKGTIAASCESTLQALKNALAKRGFRGAR